MVSINDTGQGIDPEIMHRLFDKFASRSFHGTGIGLFISKGIIEAHGGKIWAEIMLMERVRLFTSPYQY